MVRLRALIAENAKKAESAPVAVAAAEGGEAATTAEAPKEEAPKEEAQRKKLQKEEAPKEEAPKGRGS